MQFHISRGEEKKGKHLVVDGGDNTLVRDEDIIDDVDVAVVALDVHGGHKGGGVLSTPDE